MQYWSSHPAVWLHMEERTPPKKQGFRDALSVRPPGTHPMSHTHLGLCTVLLGCLDRQSPISASGILHTVGRLFAEVDVHSASLGSQGRHCVHRCVCHSEDHRMTLGPCSLQDVLGGAPTRTLAANADSPGGSEFPRSSRAESTTIYRSAYL